MADPAAARYMDHFAYHGYDCQFNCTKQMNQYDKIAEVHSQWPEKEVRLVRLLCAQVQSLTRTQGPGQGIGSYNAGIRPYTFLYHSPQT